MQATSATYHPVAGATWLTTTSLILIVVLAAITLAMILYGMRLAAQRRHARRVEEERVELEGDGADATATLLSPPPPADMPLAPPVDVPPAREPSRVEAAPAPPLVRFEAPVAPAPAPAAPPLPPIEAGPIPGTPAADPSPLAPSLTDEPIAAAAPLDAAPAVEAEPASIDDQPQIDDQQRRAAAERPLTRLKGLGPKVATRLKELGIDTVGDLAALDDVQAEAIDARLGPFTGRMARDRWIEQARLLASGDDKGFEATFGKL